MGTEYNTNTMSIGKEQSTQIIQGLMDKGLTKVTSISSPVDLNVTVNRFLSSTIFFQFGDIVISSSGKEEMLKNEGCQKLNCPYFGKECSGPRFIFNFAAGSITASVVARNSDGNTKLPRCPLEEAFNNH